MIIKVKTRENIPQLLPRFIDKGDWVDLYSAETVKLPGLEILENSVGIHSHLIDLGVAMQLPIGFEAIAVPRSSLFKKKGILMGNSIGIIDNTYCGNEDYWKFMAVATRDTVVNKGEAICQFRIQPSQKASMWVKLRWLFCNKIKIKVVSSLQGENRGGFGSTGGYK